ncbi:hypothetical protein A0H81_07973 [Grifola frondosa]|uniref:F-box domain-containing protein n=1 Tax=Grifola frondosa TaxID=5627 RepID=A0A1C7M6K7_GRIFR|nr:hypothetical protein A0H81_07973 [Grifola frondosa]
MNTSCDDYKVLKWLVSESLHHSIERLSCTRLRWANILSLKDALQSLASSLLDLEIGFDDMPDPNDICTTSFNIAPLPILTSLTLHIHVSRLSVMPYNFFVLSELESPLLKSVRFVVKCHSLESLCMIPLVELAFILSQPRFSNLSEVYFKFRGALRSSDQISRP